MSGIGQVGVCSTAWPKLVMVTIWPVLVELKAARAALDRAITLLERAREDG